MRKATVFFIIMVVICGSAFCAGKLSVTQENFYVIPSWWTTAYAFAKVENTGDKPIKINAGVLEIYDQNGDVITSNDYISDYASYLKPGEYTYVEINTGIDEINKPVGDYMMTLTGKSDNSSSCRRLPCETELKLNVGNSWLTYNYMYALVTNNTDAPLYGIKIVLALLDENDNIMYIADDDLYSNRALPPGSSIIFRENISSDFIDYFKTAGIEPSKIDAIAYVVE